MNNLHNSASPSLGHAATHAKRIADGKPSLKRGAAALLALGLASFGASAVAAEALKTPFDMQSSHNQRFGIDANQGGAWVEFDAPDDFDGSDETQRVTVPGLSYDADARQIVLAAQGQRTICAQVRKVGGQGSKQTRIEPTGFCELSLRSVDLPVSTDIGFYKMAHYEVQLKVSGESAWRLQARPAQQQPSQPMQSANRGQRTS